MNNCLVTKLKGNVPNPKLRVLNGMVIEVVIPTASAALWITSNKNQSVKVFGSTGNIIRIESLVANTQKTISLSSIGTYYVVIEDVYAITQLYPHSSSSFGGADDDKYNLLYFDDLLSTDISGELSFEDTTYMELSTGNVIKNDKVTTFTLSAGFSGDIANVGQFIGLTALKIKQTNVLGTIESMLDRMYANGRTSGKLVITPQHINSGITYDGSTLPFGLDITFSQSGWSRIIS